MELVKKIGRWYLRELYSYGDLMNKAGIYGE